jgi:hypothetical protein
MNIVSVVQRNRLIDDDRRIAGAEWEDVIRSAVTVQFGRAAVETPSHYLRSTPDEERPRPTLKRDLGSGAS